MNALPVEPAVSRRAVLAAAGTALVTPGLLGGCGAGQGADGTSATATPSGSAPAAATGLTFPPNFVWGAATSAYQIEGAAREDGRGESIWDRFSRTPGKVRGGDTGDVAADHYHRWESDLDLMVSLGIRGYRFSLAWPRIQPTGRGPVNQRGLDFYKRLVEGLHKRNITPMATLYHWDLPQALHDAGGWEARDSAKWFADYAELVFRAIGDSVPTWLTINEPKTIANVGYRDGVHAPGKRDPGAALVVAHHLMLAHGLAVQAFRAAGVKHRIGPALNLAPVYPATDGDQGSAAVALADAQENRLYLDSALNGRYPADLLASPQAQAGMTRAIKDGDLKVISTPNDLLAVQYYNPVFVTASGRYVTKLPTSVASWQQIHPEGLTDVLTRVKRDYGDIPITITENGIPVADRLTGDRVADPKRVEFLRDHLAAAHRAIQQGVRLEGYHVWSLLDNFEWAEGYSQRWGLVYVDYASQRRIPKDSANWYRDVIKRNGI